MSCRVQRRICAMPPLARIMMGVGEDPPFVACTVAVLSDTRAVLQVSEAARIPHVFRFRLDDQAATCRATVTWRSETELAVTFTR